MKEKNRDTHPLFQYHQSTVQAKNIFFCYILTLLAKWNMIFCLYGAFLENSLSKQNFPSPHMLAVCMQGEGESLSFFLRLAALCMVLPRRFKILLGRWVSGTNLFAIYYRSWIGGISSWKGWLYGPARNCIASLAARAVSKRIAGKPCTILQTLSHVGDSFLYT